jgi:5-formaminoimidazole-4-carboxamide-1-(beta)-D-ribofuranosyl 5'-monophosphate synthetase
MKPAIVTLGSHSALQIAKGAHDEGLHSIVVATPKQKSVYERFPFIDELIVIDNFADFPSLTDQLKKKHAIVIPHGSFVAYLGMEENLEMQLDYFGSKQVIVWEFDRLMQRKWIEEAGILVPKRFKVGEPIDRTVIVKTYGAAGGSGYFLARTQKDLEKNAVKIQNKEYLMQEYIIGVPMYVHYFYSPLTEKLEIMSIDRRYETNADGLGRLPIQHQDGVTEPSYTVVGNSSLVVRESLLVQFYDMGQKAVDYSKKHISKKGLFGPFCLEMVIDEQQRCFVIEISARIVAGTNLFIKGSPYSDLLYDEPMSTGRRIAREIRTAAEQKELHKVLHED